MRNYMDEVGRDPATFPVGKRVYIAIDNDKERAAGRLEEWFDGYYHDAARARKVSVFGSEGGSHRRPGPGHGRRPGHYYVQPRLRPDRARREAGQGHYPQALTTMRIIDFRSDTVTHPTPEMYEAMLTAELGDDEYGDDPTVNRLEALAAEKLGKEAALFTVSGTMSNLVAILTHCNRGDELIVGDQSHIFLEEGGGASGLGNVHIQTLHNGERGTLDPDEVEQAIRPDDPHDPPTGLIALENTHTYCGRVRIDPGRDRGSGIGGTAARSPAPRRWCADIQRLGLSGDSDLRAGEGCGLGELLPIQGTVLPHRLDALRQRRVHPAGPILAGDSGWWDEAGGSYCRHGHRGTGEHDRATGPKTTPTPDAWLGA